MSTSIISTIFRGHGAVYLLALFFSHVFKKGDSGAPVVAVPKPKMESLRNDLPLEKRRSPRPPSTHTLSQTFEAQGAHSFKFKHSTDRPEATDHQSTKDLLVGLVITKVTPKTAGLCVLHSTIRELERTQTQFTDIRLFGCGVNKTEEHSPDKSLDSGFGGCLNLDV